MEKKWKKIIYKLIVIKIDIVASQRTIIVFPSIYIFNSFSLKNSFIS
jgi:hypothetical protein